MLYSVSQIKLLSRRCTQEQRRCESSGWHWWSRRTDGSKNPDFSTRAYVISKQASLLKEWLALGCLKDDHSVSWCVIGTGVIADGREREIAVVEQLTEGGGSGIVVRVA